MCQQYFVYLFTAKIEDKATRQQTPVSQIVQILPTKLLYGNFIMELREL